MAKNNVPVGDSQLSGMLDNTFRLASWLDNLAENNKEAILDDQDQNAIPDDIGEDNLFESDPTINYTLEEKDITIQPWSPTSDIIVEHISATNESRTPVEHKEAGFHSEVDALIKDADIKSLSQLKDVLAKEYSSYTAEKFIKHNFQHLQTHLANDLETQDAGLLRISDVKIDSGNEIKNKKLDVKYDLEDVKKTAKKLALQGHDLKAGLLKEYSETLVHRAFPEGNFDVFATKVLKEANIDTSDIDRYVKELAVTAKSIDDIDVKLVDKFGAGRMGNFQGLSKLSKFLHFKESRNDGSFIDRVASVNKSKDVKDLVTPVDHTADLKKMRKEAYLSLATCKTLDQVTDNL